MVRRLSGLEMDSTTSDSRLEVIDSEEEDSDDFDFEEGQPLLLLPHGQPCTSAKTLPFQQSYKENHGFLDDKNNVRSPRKGQKHVDLRTRLGWRDVYQPRTLAIEFLPPPSSSRCRILVVVAMLLSFAAAFVWVSHGAILCHASTPSVPDAQGLFFPPVIQDSWAAYTPYFPAAPYAPPPLHCTINQVNILQRHGARFPTSGATARIVAAVQNLQSATQFLDPRLAFLKNYTYALGTNDLVPFGALQSQEAGKEAFNRYSFLLSRDNIPFIRASSSSRVVDSANNWTAAFSLASNQVFNPVLSVILDESLNDTLDDAMCPNAGSSDPQTNTWTSIYGAPIAADLNAEAPGATLAAADISNLIPLCAFETVAKETPSPFCNLFTPEQFAQFEYFGDLDKFYGTGYGQALGPVQGVGYINELLARLTDSPVQDNTQTNRTLDASPITFPLNRTLYADFSHDNQMAAIYAAMGLFKQPAPLDPTQPDPRRTWIASRLTPFSARMVTERLSCNTNQGKGKPLSKPQTFVRILVNDALQPLEFCGGDQDGLCSLDAFVESQAYARNDGEGDFEKCFS